MIAFFLNKSKYISGMEEHFTDSSICNTSCYSCLRSYQNRRFHPLLNWKLAVDTAFLLKEKKVDTLSIDWLEIVSNSLESLGKEFKKLKLNDFPAVQHERTGNIGVFSHPFLLRNKRHRAISLSMAHREAENRIDSEASIVHLDYFDIIHRPWKVAGYLYTGSI